MEWLVSPVMFLEQVSSLSSDSKTSVYKIVLNNSRSALSVACTLAGWRGALNFIPAICETDMKVPTPSNSEREMMWSQGLCRGSHRHEVIRVVSNAYECCYHQKENSLYRDMQEWMTTCSNLGRVCPGEDELPCQGVSVILHQELEEVAISPSTTNLRGWNPMLTP